MRKPCFGLAGSIRSSASQEHQSPVSESHRDQKWLADSMYTDQLFPYALLKYCFLYSAKQGAQQLCHLSSSAISSAKMQVFNLMVSSGLRIADPVALIQGKVSQKTQQNTPLSQQMFFLQGKEF